MNNTDIKYQDYMVDSPKIEIVRVSGKHETIAIKTKFLVPVIAKAILKDARMMLVSIKDHDLKFEVDFDNQPDNCLNVLHGYNENGNYRLIF